MYSAVVSCFRWQMSENICKSEAAKETYQDGGHKLRINFITFLDLAVIFVTMLYIVFE